MRGWPVTYAQSLANAIGYGLSRQYHDAEVEFLRAARIAREAFHFEDEQEMLASAWFARLLDEEAKLKKGHVSQTRPQVDPDPRD